MTHHLNSRIFRIVTISRGRRGRGRRGRRGRRVGGVGGVGGVGRVLRGVRRDLLKTQFCIRIIGPNLTYFRYDLDADGVVSSKEVGQIMRAIGQNPSEAEIQAYI